MPHTRLCSCRDGLEAHFLQSLLESEGIPATILGESLEQLLGSLPITHARPELWVSPDDLPRATRLIGAARSRKVTAAAAPAWECPHCAEIVEGQFSECWKCQTPRPAEGAASADPAAGGVEPVIDTDLSCHRCRYNLRGLPASHACPECGLPLIRTLLASRSFTTDHDAHAEPRALQSALRYLATGRGYPTPAVIFLLDAYAQLLDLAGPDSAAALDYRSIDVTLFCHAMAHIAVDHFVTPERTLEQFAAWRLHTSTDLARALSLVWNASPDQLAARFHPPVPLETFVRAMS